MSARRIIPTPGDGIFMSKIGGSRKQPSVLNLHSRDPDARKLTVSNSPYRCLGKGSRIERRSSHLGG